jgi:hypothetical protein
LLDLRHRQQDSAGKEGALKHELCSKDRQKYSPENLLKENASERTLPTHPANIRLSLWLAQRQLRFFHIAAQMRGIERANNHAVNARIA